jgi:hypothetical protein
MHTACCGQPGGSWQGMTKAWGKVFIIKGNKTHRSLS